MTHNRVRRPRAHARILNGAHAHAANVTKDPLWRDSTSAIRGRSFTDLVIPAITIFRGRFVETMRDGMLVEFASIIEEVRCAVANPR
jgi:hypothetical protein